MDTKAPANLDPKLKEVYDRVMGSANPASSPPPQTTPPQSPVKPLPQAQVSPVSPLSPSPFPQTPTKPLGSNAPLPNQPAAPTPTLGTTMPTPPKPLGNLPVTPPTPSHNEPNGVTSPLGKPVVDYAALAAKFATPTPTINSVNGAVHPTPVTPSTTTYGVVDNKPAKDKSKETKTDGGGSPMKKILLIGGIPLILIGYTAVWIFLFHVDIMSFLPLPK
jgi:hypothetical protein